jgi:hypothetical protein
MNELLLPMSVRTRSALDGLRARLAHSRLAHAWQERDDETGLDEAVTKMIWLAVGITVALAAGVFFTGVFETARDSVPDPVAP